jgi:hypothetical protein
MLRTVNNEDKNHREAMAQIPRYIYFQVCQAVGCFARATDTIKVEAGNQRIISLLLCGECVPKILGHPYMTNIKSASFVCLGSPANLKLLPPHWINKFSTLFYNAIVYIY